MGHLRVGAVAPPDSQIYIGERRTTSPQEVMTMLRGKKPEERNPRLKALLFGEAGVGKTTAAIQMPRPYIIDCEDGTAHYGKIIEDKGGAVFTTNSIEEVITEVRSLMSEPHNYLTLVIDPFTALYDTELEEGERKVGAEFGRHYGHANKASKRLYNLLTALDMNVVITAHSKNQYGDSMKVTGTTFDGWKRLDYLFDLVFCLERSKDGRRVATVRKTRIENFVDQSKFEWSYDSLAERYGRQRLERAVESVELSGDALMAEFSAAYGQLTEPEIKRLKIDKVINSLDDLADLPRSRVERGLASIRAYLKSGSAAA
jgi:hypothetical protein